MESIIQKAIAKATGESVNAVVNGRVTSLSLEEATQALQWALETTVDEILASLREQLTEMQAHPKDQKHCYGFELAIDLVNDNFTE